MPELTQLTAAVRELKLADGKVYQLSPLDLTDFGEIDDWLAEFVKDRARRRTADLPKEAEEIKKKILEEAYILASRISFALPEGVRTLLTPAGTAQLLWRSIRKKHPSVTLEEAQRLINGETLQFIQDKLDQANKLADPSKGKEKGVRT
jgi:hypothetical protein